MPRPSSNWLRTFLNRSRSKRLTLKGNLLLAKRAPTAGPKIVSALSSLSPAEREVICDGMFRVLEHPRHSLNLDARIGAVNVVLAMPSYSVPRLRRLLAKRSRGALEVQFTVFVFIPMVIDALRPAESRLLEKVRIDYLRRPASEEAASEAAYGMTLDGPDRRVVKRLLGIYSESPSLVSRMAALDALKSSHFHMDGRVKSYIIRELKKRRERQRDRRLRFFTRLTLEWLAKH
jgi:hypothetical protein